MVREALSLSTNTDSGRRTLEKGKIMAHSCKILALALILSLTEGAHEARADDDQVVVYSARKEHLIKPLFDAFEKETKIKVSYITDKEAPLLARLQAEGKRTPADILFTVDAGNLWHAAHLDLLAPYDSKVLKTHVPSHLRDPQHRWNAYSLRARTIAYSPERVKSDELKGYKDLASKSWKGRLCLRTSKKVYNQSLVAMLIAEHGVKETEAVVKGWVQNLATSVFADDTSLLKAIDAGQCDVGIVNSYYFARLKADNSKLKVNLHWPSKADGGVHINVSGAGLTKYAKHPEAAKRLLDWLAQPKAQALFAELNYEFPVDPKVKPAPMVAEWLPFDQILINVSKAGAMQKDAIELMDRVGYK